VAILGQATCYRENTGLPLSITALNGVALERKWQGIFLLLFVPTMILACLFAAELLSHLSSWEKTGPMLLFMGLLTLVNAPFDWASLGLTRALLRRGLELGGWWPFVLALADAAVAAVIVVGLLFTIVIGVQTFGHLAQHGGGADLIRVDKILDGVVSNPSAPEYWWAYALLLSTMIPSLINLAIGGTSLLRGILQRSGTRLHALTHR
jgi:hypothetical protein